MKQVRFHLHHRNLRGESSSSSINIKVTPYDHHAIENSIQNLARSTAPIGKALDYIPNELDRMNMEREIWSQEYARYAEDYTRMKQKTEKNLDPLKVELNCIDEEIDRVKALMMGAKTKINRNEELIRARLHRFIEHHA